MCWIVGYGIYGIFGDENRLILLRNKLLLFSDLVVNGKIYHKKGVKIFGEVGVKVLPLHSLLEAGHRLGGRARKVRRGADKIC